MIPCQTESMAPVCPTCRDHGIYGGKLPPSLYAGPWKFCTCPAGAELRNREPDVVDAANRARATLLQIGAKTSPQRNLRQIVQAAVEDGYQGDF